MAAHKLSVEATRDIDEIFEYSLTEFGLAQAKKYYRSLKQCFESLGAYPYIGRERVGFKPPLRSHCHQRHVIFYRVCEDHILIVRVLHERMDPERHL